MIQVNIAALKARLSFYLGQVKEGQELVVLDRKTPVAIMEPFHGAQQELILIRASKNPSSLKHLKIKPVKQKIDVVGLLSEERARR